MVKSQKYHVHVINKHIYFFSSNVWLLSTLIISFFLFLALNFLLFCLLFVCCLLIRERFSQQENGERTANVYKMFINLSYYHINFLRRLLQCTFNPDRSLGYNRKVTHSLHVWYFLRTDNISL